MLFEDLQNAKVSDTERGPAAERNSNCRAQDLAGEPLKRQRDRRSPVDPRISGGIAVRQQRIPGHHEGLAMVDGNPADPLKRLMT